MYLRSTSTKCVFVCVWGSGDRSGDVHHSVRYEPGPLLRDRLPWLWPSPCPSGSVRHKQTNTHTTHLVQHIGKWRQQGTTLNNPCFLLMIIIDGIKPKVRKPMETKKKPSHRDCVCVSCLLQALCFCRSPSPCTSAWRRGTGLVPRRTAARSSPRPASRGPSSSTASWPSTCCPCSPSAPDTPSCSSVWGRPAWIPSTAATK